MPSAPYTFGYRRLREARGVLLVKSCGAFVPGPKWEKTVIKNILVSAAIGFAGFAAQANELSNGSFESNGLNGAEYCYGCGAADWNAPLLISSLSGAWGNPSANAGTFQLGTTVAGIQNNQILTSDFDIVAGHTYTLTWDDAGRSYYYDHTYDVSVGGVTFHQFLTTAGQAWSEHTESFTASTDGALTFSGDFDIDGTSFIDNVSLITTAVPEPTSLLMMAIGTLGLLAWRRRAQV
jgi:hypothetical protein